MSFEVSFDDPFSQSHSGSKQLKSKRTGEEKKKPSSSTTSSSRKSRDGSNDTSTTKSSSASHSGDERSKPSRRKERPSVEGRSKSATGLESSFSKEMSFDDNPNHGTDEEESKPRPRTSRRRASCIGGPAPGASTGIESHISEDRTRGSSVERSVDGSVDSGGGGPKSTRRRAGRRASTIGAAAVDSRVSSEPAPEIDYNYRRSNSSDNFGYGAGAPDSSRYGYGEQASNDYGYGAPSGDYGYGDAQPTAQANTEQAKMRRAGRRSSVGMILDDFKSGGADVQPASNSKRDLSGSSIQQNIMVPMAGAEKPQRRGRRASLLGAVGAVGGGVVGAVGTVGGVAAGAIGFGGKKEDEALDEKKARRAGLTRTNSKDNVLSTGFDRDRRRTGNLAGSKDRTAKSTSTSYSDRKSSRR